MEDVMEKIKVKTWVNMFENEREAEANYELAKKKAMWSQAAQVAEVEATKAVALREAELQRDVEKMKALTLREKLKAEFLNKALEYEIKVQEANWELYKKQKEAEAILFGKEKEAEAKKALAEAELMVKKIEAEGLVTIGQAQREYLKTLLHALGGDYTRL